MSLRSKIALALFLAVSLFQGVDLLLRQLTFGERFDELDEANARAHARHALVALEQEIADMSRAAEDLHGRLGDPEGWLGGDREGIVAALPRELAGRPADIVIAYDVAGWVHLQRVLEPRTDQPLSLRELPNERLSPDHPLVHMPATGEAANGLLITERGAVLFGTHVIERASGGPICLAVGRFLDPAALAALRTASGTQVEVRLAQLRPLSSTEEVVLARHAATQDTVVEAPEGGHLQAWSVVTDMRENPALLLLVQEPRTIARLGDAVRAYTFSSALAMAVLFPFVILLLLQWIVTGPLSRLTSHVVGVARANERCARLDLRRSDEIGQLADEFDEMFEKLARSRKEVIRNARSAGRAEVSAGVIHNVGNVLSSVKVSVDMTRRSLSKLSIQDLRVISDGLERHADDLPHYLSRDERGRHLVPFLAALAEEQEACARSAGEELDALQLGVEHIATLIGSLANYETRVQVVEPLVLSAQLDTVLELCLRSVDHDLPIEVERDYAASTIAVLDRHKLMEVLVNLLLNAIQSIQAAGAKSGRLVVRLARGDADDARVEIRDDGVGITPADLQRIFNLGYTTRPGGSGLGLHLAATTAAEMGGRVSAHSAGPGRGATFTLHLPLQPREPRLGAGPGAPAADDETRAGASAA